MDQETELELQQEDKDQIRNYVGWLVLAWERKSWLMVHVMARNIVEYMDMVMPSEEAD